VTRTRGISKGLDESTGIIGSRCGQQDVLVECFAEQFRDETADPVEAAIEFGRQIAGFLKGAS